MGKICFFNTAKVWGGGEKWHFEVSGHIHSKGYPVLVIAHRDSVLFQKLKGANIPCLGINLSNLGFLNPMKHHEICSIFKEHGFQTIVMNMSRDIKIAGPCAKRANIKRIIYRRGSAIPIKDTFLNRFLFKNVLTEVLANSQATKQTILENNGKLFPENKIRVIHNGIDIPGEQSLSQPPIGNPQKVFTLLTLGRLEKQKNQQFLIQLAKELNKRNLSFKILIGGSGRLKGQLEVLIGELKLSQQISLEGFIENPMEFMSKADLFVLPSIWEGFGYVLAEAQLCQKPVIAFDLSSNPELVVEGRTGFLVPVNDIDAFADKVQRLYENPEERRVMGLAAREHIRVNFDKKKQIQKIEGYLIDENARRK